MTASIRAGLVYFLLVFGCGFVLGTLRVTLIIPRIGELAAVALEVPILLTLSWLICRRLIRRFDVPAVTGPRLAMGAFAFALLMLAELTLSVLLAGRTPAQHWALYRDLAHQVGLVAQIGFAAMPLLQLHRRKSR
jgi:hypothetical protein